MNFLEQSKKTKILQNSRKLKNALIFSEKFPEFSKNITLKKLPFFNSDSSKAKLIEVFIKNPEVIKKIPVSYLYDLLKNEETLYDTMVSLEKFKQLVTDTDIRINSGILIIIIF